MIGAERLMLIGCLLHGAMGGEWAIRMPQNIEALSGSCVLIPCTFDIPSAWELILAHDPSSVSGQWWYRNRIKVFDSRSQSGSFLQGTITGDLLQKNCTTVMENIPINYTGLYYFRLEGHLRLTFTNQNAQIDIRDSPPKPKLTPEVVEVLEGTSVNLSCSAAAPCPDLPPNLSWTPRLGESVDQLQENVDGTKSASSVLTFTASHLHHGKKITCGARYTLQQGDTRNTPAASLTLRVQYPPKNTSVSVSPSGSVLADSSVTLTCRSDANPAVQNYTWYKVNGTERNAVGTGQNLTFNVTESSHGEQYYCEAENGHGKENSATVQLNVIYVPQISGSGSCSRSAEEISCSCESRGNPSPSLEWHVSGLRVTNSTDRVIREEQLGNTGLRSFLTVRHSQEDTPTLLCISTNTVGSSSLHFHLLSPRQHSGLHTNLLLLIIIAGLSSLSVLTVGFCLHKNKRLSRRLKEGRDDGAYTNLQLDYFNPDYDVLEGSRVDTEGCPLGGAPELQLANSSSVYEVMEESRIDTETDAHQGAPLR